MAEKIIQNPSITTNVFEYDEAGRVSAISGHPLAGEGGGEVVKSDLMWKPTVGSDGYVRWTLESSATTPDAAYISGAQGPQGPSGTNGTNGTDGKDGISPTFTITPTAGGTHVTISGAQGEDGFDVLSGAKGQDGTAGFSPTIALTPVTGAGHNNGGTQVEITYKNGESTATTAYTAWNGNDGEGASVNLFGNNGVSVTKDGANYTVGLSGGVNVPSLSAGYAQNASSATSALGCWLGGEYNSFLTFENIFGGYDNWIGELDNMFKSVTGINGIEALTDSDDYVTAFSLTDSAYRAVQYVTANSGSFVTSSSQVITGDKQYGLTTAGWTEIDIPEVGGEYLPLSGGTVSGSTYFSAATGKNMVAVASAATLIGASRQTSANFGQNTNALGTTWLGVGGAGMYRGFLKYTQGGNVADLDSDNTMQVEFTPNNKGTIFAKAKNSGNDCPETQILNPTKASCDAMTQSANVNLVSGPNYMLAKNADGQFVIGAACVNCTAISDITLAPNTYYFVYEV